MNDTYSDFVARLRNALNASKRFVDIIGSGVIEKSLEVLKERGYILDYKRLPLDNKYILRVYLAYTGRRPKVHSLRRLSTPGRRLYRTAGQLRPNMTYTTLLTTSKGVLTDREAKKLGVGGELLVEIS